MSILSQQKQSVNTDFPNLRPSLDLRFALAKKLDPRITFTRGSSGTYFGPDGIMRTAGVNEPRFDHDPITGQSLGLLVEDSRQNLLTYSEDFSNAVWNKLGSSVSTNTSITTAPDGSNNADKLIENTTNGEHRFLSSNISWVGNTRYTFSLFVKAAERTRFDMLFGTLSNWSGGRAVAFDLVSGTILSTDGATGNIIKLPNGWYRCSVTALSVASPTASQMTLRMINTGTNASYSGDGTSGIYIWGAQLEVGSFSTSYIPTDETPGGKTRSAELADMTGTNFSSWYNRSEGTIFVEYNRSGSYGASGFNRVFEISDGTAQNIFGLLAFGTTDNMYDGFTISDINYAPFNTISTTFNKSYKYSASFKENNFNRYAKDENGLLDVTKVYTLPLSNFNPTRLNIGYLTGTNIRQLGGTVARLTYYPIQLTNQQLINLTS